MQLRESLTSESRCASFAKRGTHEAAHKPLSKEVRERQGRVSFRLRILAIARHKAAFALELVRARRNASMRRLHVFKKTE
jgi:hypothetical protein